MSKAVKQELAKVLKHRKKKKKKKRKTKKKKTAK